MVSLGPFGREDRPAPTTIRGMPNARPAAIVPFRKPRLVIEFMPRRLPQTSRLQKDNLT
jgi:hypothetical protein